VHIKKKALKRQSKPGDQERKKQNSFNLKTWSGDRLVKMNTLEETRRYYKMQQGASGFG